ncbi:MAG: hypothetical protein LIP28_07225, partial [Deltaproteobacteria bacterium]|nr:hypothetical protein [Deltaproteobacteria bacterium]
MALDSIRRKTDRGRTVARAARIFAIACAVLLLVAPQAPAASEKMSLRYLRGVYVLRNLNPDGDRPGVTVPRQVRTHDTTSALLAHPDKTFVLESVARDLTAAMKTGKFPESGYYAAQALAMLGKHAEAAAAMQSYLAAASFREDEYLFLVRELHAAAAYAEVITAAREWQARAADSGHLCSEERLAYAWGSFQARGMYREAMEEVLSDPCASWRGQVFFAKSSLDLGDAEGAYARVRSIAERFPDKRSEIETLWD